MTGYVAEDTAGATARIAAAGALVDAAVSAGATTVDGPSLSVSDTDALYRQALEQAVADARAKAQALARAGGFSVGAVDAVTEGGDATPEPPMRAAAASAAAPTPVVPGTQDVTADVTVSFLIR